MKSEITKAQLAKDLGVSRAYITMIANGKRKPSKQIIDRMQTTYGERFVNESCNSILTLNQPVGGSSPPRLTRSSQKIAGVVRIL
jgi:transcriptional regulator with XRE-family HTH domain